MRLTNEVLKLTCIGLASAAVATAGMAKWHSCRPSPDKQVQAEDCVTEVFNWLPPGEQHRVFSTLKKAMELDPQGTALHIIDLGQTMDEMHGPCPMPKRVNVQLPGQSGLSVPADWEFIGPDGKSLGPAPAPKFQW